MLFSTRKCAPVFVSASFRGRGTSPPTYGTQPPSHELEYASKLGRRAVSVGRAPGRCLATTA